MNQKQKDFIKNFLQSLDEDCHKFEGVGLIDDKEIEKFIKEIEERGFKPKPLRCANCLNLINDKQGFMTFTICTHCYQLDVNLNKAIKELFEKGNKKINDAAEKNGRIN